MNRESEIKRIKDICINCIYNSPNNIEVIKIHNTILTKEEIKELEELSEFLLK